MKLGELGKASFGILYFGELASNGLNWPQIASIDLKWHQWPQINQVEFLDKNWILAQCALIVANFSNVHCIQLDSKETFPNEICCIGWLSTNFQRAWTSKEHQEFEGLLSSQQCTVICSNCNKNLSFSTFFFIF